MIYQYCASGGSTTSSGENITVESPKCRYVWVDLPGNPAQVSFAPGGGGAAGPGDYYQQQQHKFTCADALNESSEEHTSELQSLMRISYAVFCLKKNKKEQ